MPNLAKDKVAEFTAADMRNYMYGEIQSMIEGQAPKNVAFHYLMPPMPFGPELAAFMDIGPKAKEWADKGYDPNDLMRAAVGFARIVDHVPVISKDKNEKGQIVDINTLISDGVCISDVYESILKYCKVFNNTRSEADQKELDRLRALLYKIPEVKKVDVASGSPLSENTSDEGLLSGLGDGDVSLNDLFSEDVSISSQSFITDPDSISEPTTATIVYDALALQYETVVLNVLDQLKKISPKDPNGGLRKNILLNKIKLAKQKWEAQGRKSEVENTKSLIRKLSQGGMPEYLSELRDRFEGSQLTASLIATAEEGVSAASETAYYTALRPNGILSANGLMKVNIKSSNMNSEKKFKSSSTSGGAVLSFSFASVGGSASVGSKTTEKAFYSNEFEISFEIVQGLIDRPWFEKAFIESRAYTTVDPKTKKPLNPVGSLTKLSDGKIPPEEGSLKAIPMTAYFIKDLKVRSTALANLSKSEEEKFSGEAGGIVLFGFGFGGKAKHDSKHSSTHYSKADNMGEITANGTFLIGLSSVYLPDSPNPDFDRFPVEDWI